MEFAEFALMAFAPGAFWLWFFARKDVYRPEPKRLLAVSAAHGMFNIRALALPLAAIALTAVGARWTLSRFDWARRVSPFRYRRSCPKIACAACGRRIAAISRFCRFCGARAAGRRQAAALYCGRCAAPSRPDAAYCVACGDKFVL